MSGNSHQRRSARRSGARSKPRPSYSEFNEWCKRNIDVIGKALGGDCPQCKFGRIRARDWLLNDYTRCCDLCGYTPSGQPATPANVRGAYEIPAPYPVKP